MATVSDVPADSHSRRRSYRRFSLATLMAALTLIALVFAWLVGPQFYFRDQQLAVIEVQQLGGSASGSETPFGWRGRLLGGESWWEVTSVSIDGQSKSLRSANRQVTIDDESIVVLNRFPNLEDVLLRETKVSGAGLRKLDLPSLIMLVFVDNPAGIHDFSFLERMPKLRQLNFAASNIQDADLATFPQNPSLLGLSLKSNPVSSAGLIHLRGLTSLKHLTLSDTDVDDAGIEHLTELTSLEVLNLEGTAVTGAGLKSFKSSRLHALLLSGTKITNESLKEIAEIQTLESLHLSNTAVTDEGLEHLAGLSALKWVQVAGTSVTPDAARAFRRRHPECQFDITFPE